MSKSIIIFVALFGSIFGLKLFSPSSVGTRYFENSQIGILTTDYGSSRPSFQGRGYSGSVLQTPTKFHHTASYHFYDSPSSKPHQGSYDFLVAKPVLANSNNLSPSQPAKLPSQGGGGVVLSRPSYVKPTYVTSRPALVQPVRPIYTSKPLTGTNFKPFVGNGKPVIGNVKPVIINVKPPYQPNFQATTKKPNSFFPLVSNNKPGCDCKCGVKHEAFKSDNDDDSAPQNIIGGSEAQINEFPWLVRLAIQGRTFCGAALINANYVLTAAHCVFSRKVKEMQAIIGDHDQTTNSEVASVTKPLAAIYVHELYDKQNYTNDIALLKLNSPVTFSANIQPVCLPSTDTDPPARIGEIAGWGRTTEKGKGSNKALKVEIPLLSLKQCREKKIRPARIIETMLCAGEANKDSCQGDSGGPLMVQNSVNGKHEVHGVVSWGIGCGRDGYPGIYTRVSKYMDWLQRKMPDACLCN